MKNILGVLTFLAALSLCSCSSEEGDTWYGQNEFDLYGVGKWDNPDNFSQLTYLTLVDTITLKHPVLSVVIKAQDNINTKVEWTIEKDKFGSIRKDEISNNANILISTYTPDIPDDFEYTDGMQVSADATVGKNTVRRGAFINAEERERHVLSVNFGMDSDQVEKEVELLRGEGRFTMRDAGTGIENYAPHFRATKQGKTFYIFDNDKLVEVIEFPYSILDAQGSGINPQFLKLCRRLEMDGNIEDYIRDGELLQQHRWNREGIEFKFVSRDDVFPADEDGGSAGDEYLENSIGISFTLL